MRALVALLLAANLGYFAWTQGWLDGVAGLRAHTEREPERLAKQVRPETLVVLTPQEAAAAASAAAPPPVCLEAGPFAPAQVAAAEAAASAALPAGSWADVRTEQPAVWIVYMGKFASADAQQKKVEELTRREVAFEPVSGAPELEPGLALGRFDERAQADAALQKLAQQHAIRTARVVELRHATVQHRLRIAQADPSLAGRATTLQAEALGRGFVPCGKE